MKRFALFALLALILWSCAPDPRREADAFATRSLAEAEAARAAQELRQEEEAHHMKMERLNEVSQWISRTMIVATVASMFVIVVAGISLGVGLAFVFIGSGAGIAKRNMQMPPRIGLDPLTRQYPLIPIYLGKGRYSLTNPNDNSVMLLDTRSKPDALKVKAAFGVQHDGLLASRLSHTPSESPMQIVEVK